MTERGVEQATDTGRGGEEEEEEEEEEEQATLSRIAKTTTHAVLIVMTVLRKTRRTATTARARSASTTSVPAMSPYRPRPMATLARPMSSPSIRTIPAQRSQSVTLFTTTWRTTLQLAPSQAATGARSPATTDP